MMGPAALQFNLNVAMKATANEIKQRQEEDVKGPVRSKRDALRVVRLAKQGAEELKRVA